MIALPGDVVRATTNAAADDLVCVPKVSSSIRRRRNPLEIPLNRRRPIDTRLIERRCVRSLSAWLESASEAFKSTWEDSSHCNTTSTLSVYL